MVHIKLSDIATTIIASDLVATNIDEMNIQKAVMNITAMLLALIIKGIVEAYLQQAQEAKIRREKERLEFEEYRRTKLLTIERQQAKEKEE